MNIREAGDSALLMELQPAAGCDGPDVDVNARVVAIARDLVQRRLRGVRDVVPTFHSVAVFLDPIRADMTAVASIMAECAGAEAIQRGGKFVEAPVTYGGEAGPDLEEVAAFAGCTAQEVVRRHSSRAYRVFMLGFLPGFGYLGTVDSTIAAPRKLAPRVRVAAGSVGIAGRQTGIYPRESPGGWQIIGRTSIELFDANATPPALLAPGDEVRFVPVGPHDHTWGEPRHPIAHARWGPRGAARPREPDQPSRALRASAGVAVASAEADKVRATTDGHGRSVTVLKPGLLTTIQDAGRWGFQNAGVPVAGPMDAVAHRLSNLIVGNAADAAGLEATLVGPELRFEQESWIALAGADLQASLDGAHVPLYHATRCCAGSVLRFGTRRSGARAYVAVDGGIATPLVLGSRATDVRSGLGGVDGRALRAGDRIPLGMPRGAPRSLPVGGRPDVVARPSHGARLRILPGPQIDCFDALALERLQRTRYTVSPQSNRMGYRLSGETAVQPVPTGEMMSDAAFIGGLQVPPSGEPILLMVDRQTTGGYPQIGVVITADLRLAAQLLPGHWVEFQVCSRRDAIDALAVQNEAGVDLL